MVRPIVFGLVLLGLASSASAQTVDWRKAGGDLFGAVSVEPAAETTSTETGAARLDPLSQPFQAAIDAAAPVKTTRQGRKARAPHADQIDFGF